MTTPWTAPTIRPLTTAQDAQSGTLSYDQFEDNVSSPSGPAPA